MLDAAACTEPASPGATLGSPAIFLHTGWRSGGTWLWSRCRALPHVHAFYEPLHEQLARLTPADVRRLRPGSWASNHSDTPPYFQEYERQMQPGRRGVPGYLERFAYDRFFLDPDDEDPELETYIHSLLRAAPHGRVGALKFCRSLGRTAWMERRFPGALHLVVMRDPAAQWASAQRLLTVQRNRYFATVPLLVLARNASHPLVHGAAQALDVRLPQLHSPDMAYGIEACWRHLRRMPAAEHYRSFLVFWAVCGLQALRGEACVIDAGDMARNVPHRQAVQAMLAAKLGQDIDLHARTPAQPEHTPEQIAAHRAAAAWVGGQSFHLAPGRLDQLLAYLATSAPALQAQPVGLSPAPPPALPRSRLQQLVTALAVAAARALQPVRRLNGALTRPRNQIT